MHSWKLAEAKYRLSEVMARAKREGPQEITKHGKRDCVLVSAADYDRMKPESSDFKDWLLGAPKLSDDEWDEVFGDLRSDQGEARPDPFAEWESEDFRKLGRK